MADGSPAGYSGLLKSLLDAGSGFVPHLIAVLHIERHREDQLVPCQGGFLSAMPKLAFAYRRSASPFSIEKSTIYGNYPNGLWHRML